MLQSSRSDICVIIAAKDAEATIAKAISSALRQSEVSEAIVVVDGATDGTVEAARAADDHSGRLQIHSFEINRGPSAARNLALDAARADLVCVLDADDYLLEGRFAQMLDRGGVDWDFLADDLFLANESTPERLDGRLIDIDDTQERFVGISEFVKSNISTPRRARRELGYLKPLMRTSFLKSHALRYDEQLRLGEDYELYARAILNGARFKLISACGYVAVEHAGSLSHRHGAADLAALAAADLRLIDESVVLGVDAKRPLLAHYKNLKQKLDYRLMLDAKRCSDWRGVFTTLFSSPSTTVYILAEMLRASIPIIGRA